jgi:hypothetical protein
MRGGARAGAGRKKGGRNAVSERAREAAAATGELPHQFLLRVARGEPITWPGQKKPRYPTFEEMVDAAKAAAPFFAARLMAVAVRPVDPTNPWTEVLAFVGKQPRGLPAAIDGQSQRIAETAGSGGTGTPGR